MKKLLTVLAALLFAVEVSAQTVTPNLGLTLPPAQAGTWGADYNNNFLILDSTSSGGAPTGADYLTRSSDGSLTGERVVTDTPTISWDWSTAGQAKAGVVANSIGPAQVDETGAYAFTNTVFPATTVAALGAATTPNTFKIVTDGSGASCTVGGSSTRVLCISDGVSWVPVTSGAEIDTLALVCARGCSFTGAISFATGMHIGESSTVGWRIYSHPTNGPTISPVCAGVEGDCDRITTLTAGKRLEYKNSGGTAIFTLTESTGALTNITLNAESTGNTLTTVQYFSINAASCNNATAAAGMNLPTANAPTPTCFGTTTTQGTLTFADGSTQTASRNFRLRGDFTGAVDVDLVWFANAASTNAVRWSVATGCVADSEAISTGPSYNASSASNTAYTGTALQRKTTAFTGIATTNCAAGESMTLQVQRIGADAADTLAASAELLEIGLKTRAAQ